MGKTVLSSENCIKTVRTGRIYFKWYKKHFLGILKYELTLQVKYVLSLNFSVCLYSNSQSLTIQTVRNNKLKTAEYGDNKPPV